MSNKAQLILEGSDTGFDKIGKDLDTLAQKSKSAGTELTKTGQSLDKASKTATSFSQKIKDFGSKMAGTIANVGTLGATVVNLQREYRDLGDAQIAVDRSNLKVSKSTEALKKAHEKVLELTKEGKQSSDEYSQALLDEKQATEQLHVAQQNAGEAQERFNDIQQNFWMNLVPTISSAVSTAISAIKELGGTKGFSGLMNIIGGVTGSGKGGLGSIGAAAIAQIPGVNRLKTAMAGLGGVGGLGMLGGIAGPAAIAGGGIAGGVALNQNFKVFQDMAAKNREAWQSIFKAMGMGDEQIKSTIGFFDGINNALGITYTKTNDLKDSWGQLWDYSAWTATTKSDQMVVATDKVMSNLLSVHAKITKTFNEGVLGKLTSQTDPFRLITSSAQKIPPVTANLTQLAAAAEKAAAANVKMSGVFGNWTGQLGQADVALLNMSTDFQVYVKNLRDSIAADEQKKANIVALVNASGMFHASMSDDISILLEELRAVEGDIDAYDRLKRAKLASTRVTQHTKGYEYVMRKGVAVPVHKGGGPRYVTITGGKITDYGKGMAPPMYGEGRTTAAVFQGSGGYAKAKKKRKKGRHAQFGMSDIVTEPTWILAGESDDEMVHISKARHGKGDTGGGGGGVRALHVYFHPQEFARFLRYTINDDQSTVK